MLIWKRVRAAQCHLLWVVGEHADGRSPRAAVTVDQGVMLLYTLAHLSPVVHKEMLQLHV
jgi:hypothetical protein